MQHDHKINILLKYVGFVLFLFLAQCKLQIQVVYSSTKLWHCGNEWPSWVAKNNINLYVCVCVCVCKTAARVTTLYYICSSKTWKSTFTFSVYFL